MLTAADVQRVSFLTYRDLYKETFSEAVANGRLSDEELAFIEKLKNSVSLPDSLAKKIARDVKEERVNSALKNAMNNQRLSPQETEELKSISQSLGVTIKASEMTQELLNKYKLYWEIENGNPPPLQVNINLQRNENCYFTTPIGWSETRKEVKRYNYSGPTARIKIMKGVYYRAGSMAVSPQTTESLKLIDSGILYLTNKRLIFMGEKGNKQIRLTAILGFEHVGSGYLIQKSTGKSPVLGIQENLDLFEMLMRRCLKGV